MDGKKELISKLKKNYKKIFEGVWEYGGGYGYRYRHGVRVMENVQKISQLPIFKKERIDHNALQIAALFHDVGKIVAVDKNKQLIYGNYGDKSHDEIGAKIVKKYLKKYISNKNLIEKIALIIVEQEKDKENISLESKIVKDADRLDHFGVIHLWVSIIYANYQKKNIEGLKEFWEGDEGKKHYIKNLDKFYFPEVKKIAQKRLGNLEKTTELIFEEDMGKDIK